MFSINEDSITCEEGAKREVQRKGVDIEMEAIESNNTWKLKVFLRGKMNWS